MSVGCIAYFITNKNKGVESCGLVTKSRQTVPCAVNALLYIIDCRPNVVIFEELSDGSGEECLRRALSSGVLIITI